MSKQISEQFVEQMVANGWTCSDPDTLQFTRKTEGEDFSYTVCQVDYSHKAQERSGGLVVTEVVTSTKELEDNLNTEEIDLIDTDNLTEMAEEFDIDPSEYDQESLMMVVAERYFEEQNHCMLPQMGKEQPVDAVTMLGGDETEVYLSELVLISLEKLDEAVMDINSATPTEKFTPDFDETKYVAAYWGSFGEYVPVKLKK